MLMGNPLEKWSLEKTRSWQNTSKMDSGGYELNWLKIVSSGQT
jgi:hypothetical protein